MKNRLIESLGKSNQQFLKKTFGFKTIRQAKKAFGVSNNKEAYDVMKQLYNEKIEEEKEIKKQQQSEKQKKIRAQIKQSKLKFLNVLEQLGNRKKVYNVVISVIEKKTYTQYNKSYQVQNDIVKSFVAPNETVLDDLIRSDINERYPWESAYEYVELISYKYSISDTTLKPVSKMDVYMKRGKPVKASFLKFAENIDPVSYEDFNGECVLRMLLKHMDIKKDKTLISDFNDASLTLYGEPYDKKKGVSSRMILHMCQQRNISCLGFDQRDKNFVKFTADQNKKRKFRPIVFYMFMAHFYLITDPKTISSLAATFRQNNNVFHSSLEIGDKDNKNSEINYYSNLSVEECLKLEENAVVIFDKTNLNDELKKYIELTNDIPKVKNHSITQVQKIMIGNNRQLCISGALGEGLDWQSIQEFCIKADIPFTNQSVGEFICQLRDKFFVMKRAKFTPEQREEIKNNQNNSCAICKEMITEKYHIDHIKPLASGGTNDKENLQALCVSCHIEKTREEKDACEYIQADNITSAFNIQALNAVESDWFRKIAFTQPIGGVDKSLFNTSNKYSKDMNKCRRNILLNYAFDFPRYSVLDDIEIFDGKLETGFYYVESENVFPLRKNGFYSLPMVKYCLTENIIKNDDIKYQLKSSFSIEKDYFQPFVEYLDGVFENDVTLKKLAVNSLVGLFGRRKNTFVENRICDKNETDDIACAYQDFYKPYLNIINDEIVQVAGQSEIKKIESTFPIHAQILDCEAIELHKLVSKIKKHGGIPYEVKTDAVNYFANEPIDFNKPVITWNTVRNSDNCVRQLKDGTFVRIKVIRDMSGNVIDKIITEHASREEAAVKEISKPEINNQEDNYWDKQMTLPKYKDEDAKDLQKAVYIFNENKFNLSNFHYNKIDECDDFDALAEKIVSSKKGCLILGMAGTGKTYLINQIKKHLELKKQTFKCVAPTNKATLLMDGETLHKFSYALLNSKAQLKKFKGIDCLMVDEISMVQEIFYQVFMMLKHYNPEMRLIIVGDYGQLPPVNDRVIKNYKKSRCLWELVDGNKLELTKCRRSDDAHFQNCLNVRNGLPIDLNKFEKTEETYLNIAFTNKTRIEVNTRCMIRFLNKNNHKRTIKYEALPYDKNSQDITICEGMPIIARINQKSLDIVNNEMFVIKKIGDDVITVSNELKTEVNIPVDKFNKLFYLAFCITIHKSQGATFDEKYTIHEWNKQNKKMKYVALSRATDEKNIQIIQ